MGARVLGLWGLGLGSCGLGLGLELGIGIVNTLLLCNIGSSNVGCNTQQQSTYMLAQKT